MNTITESTIAEFVAALDALPTASKPHTTEQPTTSPTTPPVVGQPVAQGDLLFVPAGEDMPHWAQPITAPVDLITDGNGHRLTPTGPVRWAPVRGQQHVIGTFRVDAGGTALIDQPRQAAGTTAHAPLLLGEGTWTVRRQAEHVAPNIVRRVID